MAWPPPLRAAARRDRRARRGGGRRRGRRYGYERWTTDWRDLVADPAIGLFDNGGPNCAPRRADDRRRRGGQARALREAARPRRRRGYEIWRRVAATGVKHLCGFNYRFVPAIRLARELIEAGELGEIRHFRARYLQDWGDDPALDTLAVPAAGGRLGSDRRPRDARRRPRALPRRRDRGGLGRREDLPARPQGRRRCRGGRRVRVRAGRDDRGDPARARTAQRDAVGDQRLEGIALRSTWSG